jgi:hypothetical protein
MTEGNEATTGGTCGGADLSATEEIEQHQRWTDPKIATPPEQTELPDPPDSRSPAEWTAAEGTLIRMLCRQHGWLSVQPGYLQRPGKVRPRGLEAPPVRESQEERIILGACGDRAAVIVAGRDGTRRVWVFVGQNWTTISEMQQPTVGVRALEEVG